MIQLGHLSLLGGEIGDISSCHSGNPIHTIFFLLYKKTYI